MVVRSCKWNRNLSLSLPSFHLPANPADAVLRALLWSLAGSKSARDPPQTKHWKGPLEPEGVWEVCTELTGHNVLVTSSSSKKTDFAVYTDMNINSYWLMQKCVRTLTPAHTWVCTQASRQHSRQAQAHAQVRHFHFQIFSTLQTALKKQSSILNTLHPQIFH